MAAAPQSLPVRHPRWILTYQSQNITADISGMVTEITYTNGHAHTRGRGHRHIVGGETDEVEVTLEDRDRRWQGPWFPVRGDVVALTIGYDGERMLNCGGNFQVDELELKGPPDTFQMKCIASGITPSIRSPKSAAYENQSLLQVANTVAAAHGLTVVGAPQNINVTWLRISQRTETDVAFLRRLALAHGYNFTIKGTQLIFYSRTVREQTSPVLIVLRTQVKEFEFKTKTGQIYKTATVAYQNPQQKKLVTAQSGDSSAPTGDDLHIVARSETPQQAQLKADSALHDANMLQVTGRIETEGTVLLVAGVNIQISGFKAFDGIYQIDSSKHRLERSGGYTTEVEIRKL